MSLIFLGPPGAGKGTQGAFLAGRKGYRLLVAGDLLRKEVAQGTPLGGAIQAVLNTGRLVSDEQMIAFMEQEMEKGPREAKMVFDGYPRTVGQAEAIDRYFVTQKMPLPQVVFFEMPLDVLAVRMLSRRTCPSCGAVYNETHCAPKEAGRCDRCGSQLVKRSDDTPETIKERMAVYAERTKPLERFYEQQTGRMVRVAAEGDPETVYQLMCAKLAAAGVTGGASA